MITKDIYITILDKKANKLTRVMGTLNYGYPDGKTVDVAFETPNDIVIGVTDDRDVFCKDSDGNISVI